MILSYSFAALTNVSVLILLSMGLAVVFGTRGVINLAHGEFVMLGAYATLRLTTAHGVPFIASIAVATVVLGLFGLLVERLIVRWLYDRILDCMLATWGLSLILVQAVTNIYGSTVPGMSVPLGNFRIGHASESIYSAVLIGLALLLIAVLYVVMRRSSFGLRSRATSRTPVMAEAAGIDTARVDMITFAIGSAAAGFAGGVLAPYLGVSPTMGQNVIAQIFLAVVVGGGKFIVGTPLASLLLGSTESGLSSAFNAIIGQAGLLVLAIFIIRLLPKGLTRASVSR
jgi:branched-chain amino acid transport system permease protein